jgi:hypothetical protein
MTETRAPEPGTAHRGPRAGGRDRCHTARARLHAVGLALALVVAACGRSQERDASQDGASYRRPKNAAGRADSARVADLARAGLRRRGQGDSLVVSSFTRASNGYLLKLVPASNPSAQESGGSVWVDEDGSVTVMQEYQP